MTEYRRTHEVNISRQEHYRAVLRAMATEVPEVRERHDELVGRGTELIADYGLTPGFFTDEGRARLFIGLAGYEEPATPNTLPSNIHPLLQQAISHIGTKDGTFVNNFMTVISHNHSNTLQAAKKEIDTMYSRIKGDIPPERIQSTLLAHTDYGRTAAVRKFIEAHDVFAGQRALLGLSTEEEQPYAVRVIGLSANHDDEPVVARFVRDAGLGRLGTLPDGWLVSRDIREVCITKNVADQILGHPQDQPFTANDAINTLRHEKAHLERDWRMDNTDIGSGLNEIGAEILSGALKEDWHYTELLSLLEAYNNSIQLTHNGPGDGTTAGLQPSAYLEKLFISTPQDTSGFAHVITGIARQVGLRGMVRMAGYMSNITSAQLTSQYHTGMQDYLGPPTHPRHHFMPTEDFITNRNPSISLHNTGPATGNSIRALVSAVHHHNSSLNEARANLNATARLLQMAARGLEDTAALSSQHDSHLRSIIEAFDSAQAAVHHLGDIALSLDDYIASIT